MPTRLESYAETSTFKDVEDDGWRLLNMWLNGPHAKKMSPEEEEVIKKHSERPKPGIIQKGEKHVRKFYVDSYGSVIWRMNLQLYKIAEKYAVFPPDRRDYSDHSSSTANHHVYNQSPL